jgi:hypothetical protein
MASAMLDARQEDGAYRRVELITGQRRRRRWTAEEKARIVAESFEEGANISEIARRHGVVRGLLTVWRVEGGWRPDARVRAGTDRCSGSADGGACKSRGDDMVQRPMPWPYRDRGLRGSDPRRAGCGPVEWLSPRSNRPSEVPAALTVCLLWNCVFEAYVCVHVLRNRTTKFARGLERVAAASAEFAAGLQTSGYIIKSPWFSLAEYRYSTSLLGQKLLDCHRVLPNHVGAERKQIEVEMVLSDKAFH